MAVDSLKDLATQVILVDSENQSIGTVDKLIAHSDGMLHRAYSVLVFRKKNDHIALLMQQRSKSKYHGGGLWTNTCCSHPRKENYLIEEAVERLYIELGIKIPLIEVGRFKYFAKLDNNMFEHEIDHVLIGCWVEQKIHPDPLEVSDYCWMNVHELQNKLIYEPQIYTPWLSQALNLALKSKHFAQLMSAAYE